MIIGELSISPTVMTIATAMFVLVTVILSAIAFALKVKQGFKLVLSKQASAVRKRSEAVL